MTIVSMLDLSQHYPGLTQLVAILQLVKETQQTQESVVGLTMHGLKLEGIFQSDSIPKFSIKSLRNMFAILQS